ncbi:hypothetical protein L484_027606 [Morus notabilis]|uniref:Uncharacterized protein n=1 Tax=Morus notabilis TaxID=981085 RepID=W9RCA1_9ROSA|nr:hypothetical protein L484_027606 [Morus notabilis]
MAQSLSTTGGGGVAVLLCGVATGLVARQRTQCFAAARGVARARASSGAPAQDTVWFPTMQVCGLLISSGDKKRQRDLPSRQQEKSCRRNLLASLPQDCDLRQGIYSNGQCKAQERSSADGGGTHDAISTNQ